MRFTGVLAVALVLLSSSLMPPATQAAAACTFSLGFKQLQEAIPGVVGECVADETHAANGDALQQTTNGLLAWRKADNWTAFTNGSLTFLNGPNGIESRRNDEVFIWESGFDEAIAPLTGYWGKHGFSMQLDADGWALANWRIYEVCGDPGVTYPCDTLEDNAIVDGGYARMYFDKADGEVATGQIMETNDPENLPLGSVLLILREYGTAELSSEAGSTTLCGENFGAGAPEDFIQSAPCGA